MNNLNYLLSWIFETSRMIYLFYNLLTPIRKVWLLEITISSRGETLKLLLESAQRTVTVILKPKLFRQLDIIFIKLILSVSQIYLIAPLKYILPKLVYHYK